MKVDMPPEDLAHVQANVGSWDRLRGKRLFLTGASGFVGTWLTESFQWVNRSLALDADLVAIPRDSLPTGAFDFGIHAAKVDSYWADMLDTKRILDFSVSAGVSRFLFASSGAVYGKLPAGINRVAEDFAGAPYPHDTASSYAQAKRSGEFLCAEYSQRFGFASIIARMFTFCGPGLPLDANFAVGNFIRDVMAGGPLILQGNGSAQRSYLYAADLAIWLWTLLLDGQSARPYNVGSPASISIRDLAETVVATTKSGTQIIVVGDAPSSVYVPSVKRALNELSLQPLISLPEGIRRMYAWNIAKKVRETRLLQPTFS